MSLRVKLRVTNVLGGVVPGSSQPSPCRGRYSLYRGGSGRSRITEDDVTAVAVTYGPGLVGALLVGLSAAKALLGLMDLR